jgi:hypothetical protein
MADTIVTFTSRSLEEILETGGSQEWKLSRKNARNATYLVCARNRHGSLGDGPEPHKSGFLVGKISGLAPGAIHPERFLVQISEWAPIEVPDLWDFGRNPVHYADVEDLGIDLESLDWQQMPERSTPEARPAIVAPVKRLTIEQAKRGLAATFGVAVDAIEITIRA